MLLRGRARDERAGVLLHGGPRDERDGVLSVAGGRAMRGAGGRTRGCAPTGTLRPSRCLRTRRGLRCRCPRRRRPAAGRGRRGRRPATSTASAVYSRQGDREPSRHVRFHEVHLLDDRQVVIQRHKAEKGRDTGQPEHVLLGRRLEQDELRLRTPRTAASRRARTAPPSGSTPAKGARSASLGKSLDFVLPPSQL